MTFNCQFRPSQCAYDAVAAAAAAAADDDDDDDDDHIAVNSKMPTFPVVVLRFKKVDSQLAMMGVTW